MIGRSRWARWPAAVLVLVGFGFPGSLHASAFSTAAPNDVSIRFDPVETSSQASGTRRDFVVVVENHGSASISPVRATMTLPPPVHIAMVFGEEWDCVTAPTEATAATCTHDGPLTPSAPSAIHLTTAPGCPGDPCGTIRASVGARRPDADASDHTVETEAPVQPIDVPAAAVTGSYPVGPPVEVLGIQVSARPREVSVTDVADDPGVEVLGIQMARTGGAIGLTVAGGLLFVGIGMTLIVLVRRRSRVAS